MAILKSALEESLLSKSEQAALRVLARVSMLSEGLQVLSKLESEIGSERIRSSTPISIKIGEYKKYLNQAIDITLLQHRLPVLSSDETKSQSNAK